MKLLFPVDGSVYTKHMLAYVAAHDELIPAGSELVFLHVVAELPALALRQIPASTVEEVYDIDARAVFEPIRALARQRNWSCRFERREGSAPAQIAAFADREGVALIVMGSHGHGALANVALGSVACGVLARCKRPLLLVR